MSNSTSFLLYVLCIVCRLSAEDAHVIGLAVGHRSATCRTASVGQHRRARHGRLAADADHSERRAAAATAAAAAVPEQLGVGVRELAVFAHCCRTARSHADVPDAAASAAAVLRVGVVVE